MQLFQFFSDHGHDNAKCLMKYAKEEWERILREEYEEGKLTGILLQGEHGEIVNVKIQEEK